MAKKIVLVFPSYPIPRVFPKRVQIPLGLTYIAGVLIKAGHHVRAIDAVVEGWEKTNIIHKKFIEYGLPPSSIMEIIDEEKPDVVGISCMFGVQLKNSLDLAEMIKARNNAVHVMLGGAHASAVSREILEANRGVDYVVLGEGEQTVVALLEGISTGCAETIGRIDGLAFKDTSGRIIVNEKKYYIEDLDSLPFPARDVFPLEKYFQINRPHGTISKHNRNTSIVTSRGCPAKCVFCAIHSVWGRSFRVRSPKNVVDEIVELHNRYGIKELQIEDDNMTFDAGRFEMICDLLLEHNLDLHFTTPNGIAIWTLNKNLLAKMRKVGFYRLTLAVESGSPSTLNKIIKKPLNLEKVKYIIDEAAKLGFIIDTFYVIGLPGESPDEMKKTFKFSRRLNVNSVKYFIATPYAGSDLYELAKSKNMLVPGFDTSGISVTPVYAQINTEYFTAKQLEAVWLRETVKTQLLLFMKSPVKYTREILLQYLKKDVL